jgi:hypothetical protein
MLTDLSSVALEWAKNYVRQRQTFKLNTKGENMAPLAFQHDPDGTYHDLAVQLRNGDFSFDLNEEDTTPILEPIDEEEKTETGDLAEQTTPASKSAASLPKTSLKTGILRLTRTAFPETPDEEAARKFLGQKAVISEWINDPRHEAKENCRHVLELYVTDLQLIYDEARCFFLQWVIGKEIKELINSARISAV